MTAQLIDWSMVKEAERNLDQIARDHSELIDRDKAKWTADDVAELIQDDFDQTPENKRNDKR